ncbi:ABC transporter substrate-binding protein [Thiohalorhabdus methylotrophus]|uniref:ABC transporter substrate-binding protein n=1 Tax=Thiohalorhabdus methylotrophus TaxID=3242694 RepID=A0ABV4TSF2_9GAMM
MRRHGWSARIRGWLAAVALGVGGLAAPPAAPAATGEKPPTIFMVLWRGMTDAERGFQAYFRENDIPVKYIVRNAAKDLDRLEGIREEIKRVRPDLVYTFGTTVTSRIAGTARREHADKYVTDIPVVFNIVADPLGAGLTRSLERTGRNLTGTSHSVPLSSQLKTLRRIEPVEKLGALYNPLERNSALAVQELARLARERGMEFHSVNVRVRDAKPQRSSISHKVAALAEKGVRFVYLPSDSFLISNAEAVVQAIHDRGMITFSATEGPISDAGAFVGIVSLYFNVGKFAGHKAARILVDGKDPASIPIETLERYTILVNMRTARKLDYFPPVPVLEFAKVVQQ